MRIDPASGIVLLQGSGEIRYDEWEREVLTAIKTVGGALRRLLSDRRQLATDYRLGLVEGALRFFRAHADVLGEAQWAVVFAEGSGALQTAVVASRMAESTRVRIKVFTSLRPAIEWLLGAYEVEEVDRLEQWINSAAPS